MASPKCELEIEYEMLLKFSKSPENVSHNDIQRDDKSKSADTHKENIIQNVDETAGTQKVIAAEPENGNFPPLPGGEVIEEANNKSIEAVLSKHNLLTSIDWLSENAGSTELLDIEEIGKFVVTAEINTPESIIKIINYEDFLNVSENSKHHLPVIGIPVLHAESIGNLENPEEGCLSGRQEKVEHGSCHNVAKQSSWKQFKNLFRCLKIQKTN